MTNKEPKKTSNVLKTIIISVLSMVAGVLIKELVQSSLSGPELKIDLIQPGISFYDGTNVVAKSDYIQLEKDYKLLKSSRPMIDMLQKRGYGDQRTQELFSFLDGIYSTTSNKLSSLVMSIDIKFHVVNKSVKSKVLKGGRFGIMKDGKTAYFDATSISSDAFNKPFTGSLTNVISLTLRGSKNFPSAFKDALMLEDMLAELGDTLGPEKTKAFAAGLIDNVHNIIPSTEPQQISFIVELLDDDGKEYRQETILFQNSMEALNKILK